MYSSQEWWSSGADQGGGDPGDPIGQSLRFRGAQRLDRTWGTPSDQNVFTYSVWIKRADAGTLSGEMDILMSRNRSTANASFLFNSQKPSFNSGNVFLVAPVVLRDPSAWYHLLFNQNGNDFSIFCNGELACQCCLLYCGNRFQEICQGTVTY